MIYNPKSGSWNGDDGPVVVALGLGRGGGGCAAAVATGVSVGSGGVGLEGVVRGGAV